ncbi:MAG: hypothetical protein H6907_09880 [Hyphomicrobiales bacterium]|nr:hypothetical protein [Hyphomicrobiales bacterium]MCP5372028.1 hypothetical protein [Hyphomicrobiales bacterium]
MIDLRSTAIFLLKTLILVVVLAMAQTGPAEAKKSDQCSAEGQKPCPAVYKGTRCDAGLGIIGGLCRRCGAEGQVSCPPATPGPQCQGGLMKIDGRCYARCGGPGEKACPKVKRGYPCRGSYEPDNRGFCQPCGGPGQSVCRALKAGSQCQPGLVKFGGECLRCGGANQRACPKLARGYPCDGKYEPDPRGYCKPCGGKGETACRALKAGKRCEPGLHNMGGTCDSCGGPGEKACPKVFAGFPCRGKYEPDNRGICTPCGGKGQSACRALKAGAQCNSGLHNLGGTCDVCGGPDQKACPKILAGFPCHGQYEPNGRGICKPCGGTGQPACRVLKQGRQCAEWTTARGGVCEPCGREGQGACRITDRGKPCADGLKRGLNGICKISREEAVKRAAMAQIPQFQNAILPLVGMAAKVDNDDNLKRSLNEGDDGSDADGASTDTRQVCFGGRFGAVTIGVGAEAGLIVNVEGEAGIAIRCGAHGRGKDTKLYSSGSINWRAGGGATGGATVGLWVDDFNNLRGNSHGYVLDLMDVVGNGKALAKRDFTKVLEDSQKLTWDVALGVWFERVDEDGDGKDDEVGRFLGFTITGGKAIGLDVGGAYVRATTVQKCDTDMKCTEGFWAGGGHIIHITEQTGGGLKASIDDRAPTFFKKDSYRHYDDKDVGDLRFRKNFKRLKYKPNGGSEVKLERVHAPSAEGVWSGDVDNTATTIVIDEQVKNRTKVRGGRDRVEEYLYAAVDNGARTRFDRGWGRTWKAADGATIKFRKNWKELRYKSARGAKGKLAKTGETVVPVASDRINVLGQWDFLVNGQRKTEEFVEQTDGHIKVRRVPTTLDRYYDNSGRSNEYTSVHGGTFRFVSDTRAIWISPDGQTVFQLNKR